MSTDSKIEMDVLDALDEIKAINQVGIGGLFMYHNNRHNYTANTH
jgi:hypothetical protein